MDERLVANRAMWDEWTNIHIDSEFYALQSFLDGRSTLHQLERDEVGPVSGKSLLHLQCHFGLDTMSWSRLGAQATGIDFSPNAIDTARTLSKDLRLDTKFVCSDVYDLPSHLEGQFDIVFTSYGVLTWLPDLDRWAQVVRHFLKDGGVFYIAEQHPAGGIYEMDAYPLQIDESYFRDGAKELKTTESYADRSAPTTAERQYQWRHPLATVVTALAGVGLQVEFLHEFPFCMFQRHSSMTKHTDGWWYLPKNDVPMLFSIRAAATSS